MNPQVRPCVLTVSSCPDLIESVRAAAIGLDAQMSVETERTRIPEALQRGPHLVIIDLAAAGVDAIEVLHQLHCCGCTMPVLLLGSVEPRLLASARTLASQLGLSVAGALTSPIEPAALERILRVELPLNPTVEDLQGALAAHEFELHYLPTAVRGNGGWQIAGAEGLIRWNHPRRGLILPRQFLHVAAESSRVTAGLADFAITEAIRQLGQWRFSGFDVAISVNIAPQLVRDRSMPERLLRTLDEYDVPPELFTIEVTGAPAAEDRLLLLDALTRLRLRGVGLTLDNFGQGPSLAELYRLPFTEMKLSGALSSDALRIPAADAVLRAVISLGRTLGLRICGSRVEETAVMANLVALGCDSLQGKLISAPLPAAELPMFAAGWSPHSVGLQLASGPVTAGGAPDSPGPAIVGSTTVGG